MFKLIIWILVVQFKGEQLSFGVVQKIWKLEKKKLSFFPINFLNFLINIFIEKLERKPTQISNFQKLLVERRKSDFK